MGFKVVQPDELEWETRPSERGEAERHVAALTDRSGFGHSRANLWRFEAGAKGRRHKDIVQEETFVVVRGTLTMYLDDPPQRRQVAEAGLIHVDSGTPLQVVNESDEELLLYVYGAPPERGHAEFMESAV